MFKNALSLLGFVLASSAFAAPLGQPNPNAAQSDCTDLEVLYTRSMSQPEFSSLVESFMTPLKKTMPNARATKIEYLVNPTDGAINIATHIHDRIRECPDQKFALMSYNKGALALHKEEMLKTLGQTDKEHILSTFTFGDPEMKVDGKDFWPTEEHKTYCLENDAICDPTGSDMMINGDYPKSQMPAQAAEYIAEMMGATNSKQARAEGDSWVDNLDDAARKKAEAKAHLKDVIHKHFEHGAQAMHDHFHGKGSGSEQGQEEGDHKHPSPSSQ